MQRTVKGSEGGWSFLKTSSKVYKRLSSKRREKSPKVDDGVTYLRMVDDLVGSPQEGPLDKLSFAERLKVMVLQLSQGQA